jgi:two-component system, sensor histidine kinase YesM
VAVHIFKGIMKFIHSECERLQLNINNRKIRTKTVYLYVFCVLIPLFVTNVFLIGNALKASNNEGKETIRNITDSVAMDITSSLENAVYVTIDLYTNNSISNFLETQYVSTGQYLKEYNRVFDHYVFYASSKQLISNITLYSDNPTMINGGRYYRIDSIRTKEWYQKFMEADTDLFIYPYYNTDTNINNQHRMISVIRKINYFGANNIEKIVKLDLNYHKIQEAVKNSAFDAVIYVCHDDKIIFTNDVNCGMKESYDSVSEINMDEVQMHKAVTAYGFDFDIYLKGYRSNYASMLKDNLWILSVLMLVDALLPAVMITLFSNSIAKRILMLGRYMKKVKGEEFDLIENSEGKDEVGELIDDFNLMVERMKNLIEYEYKSKLEQQELHLARKQAELLALYSQINPHFMFNVLESIRMRSLIKGEQETSLIIESLARLMRKSAEWGADLITLEQEIGFIRDYLNLQKYRYGEGFHYQLRIEKEYYTYMIPSLSLVNFVENACVHGLNREGHSGTILVSASKEKEFLNIEIEDTGVGMEEDQI